MYNVKLLHANCWLLGHISQQLPLGLKPISTVSYTHLQFTIIELGYRYGLGHGVGYVLLSIDLLKVDVTSIHNFLDEMVAVQNMLRPLVCFGFLRLSNGFRAITIEQNWTNKGGCYSELGDEFSQPHRFFGSI